MQLLARDVETVTLRMTRDEFSLISRGLAWLHQTWDEEAFIVTDFTRDEYAEFLRKMRMVSQSEPEGL